MRKRKKGERRGMKDRGLMLMCFDGLKVPVLSVCVQGQRNAALKL